MRKMILGLGLAFGVAFGAIVVAQEEGDGVNPDELFTSAKTAYAEKKYGKALQELSLLQGAIAKLRVKQLKGAMPAAPTGWTADEATGDATAAMMMGAGIQVRRTYRKGEDGPTVDVELISDSPMVGMMAPMLTNPAFLQGQEGKSVVTLKGKRGLLEWMKGEKSGKLSVLLNNNTSLITLSGNQMEQKEFMEAFGKAVDYGNIEKALQE